MAKRVVKKTKIKLLNLFIVLITILVLSFCVKLLLDVKTKNIIVSGTSYLNDDYVIDLVEVRNYPKFILFDSNKGCIKAKKSDYISGCKIKKRFGFILEIDLIENKALFYDTNKDKYILSNNETASIDSISNSFRVPRLLNYVPDKKYKKFITSMDKINDDSLSSISDIEYVPNEYDKDRFLLYMDDGNLVYLTLTKFKMINHYKDVYPQLEGHKGILYLDSGNHFKIME